jgi:hypothetical protein
MAATLAVVPSAENDATSMFTWHRSTHRVRLPRAGSPPPLGPCRQPAARSCWRDMNTSPPSSRRTKAEEPSAPEVEVILWRGEVGPRRCQLRQTRGGPRRCAALPRCSCRLSRPAGGAAAIARRSDGTAPAERVVTNTSALCGWTPVLSSALGGSTAVPTPIPSESSDGTPRVAVDTVAVGFVNPAVANSIATITKNRRLTRPP